MPFISDHKQIVILTHSDPVADAFETALKAESFYPDENQVSFNHKIHHWHYRPSKSLGRSDLIASLISNGFKAWNPE